MSLFSRVSRSISRLASVSVSLGKLFEIHFLLLTSTDLFLSCTSCYSASGSGKSTIAALLQRLYEPSSGSVLLDNRPLSRMDVKYLRNHLAVVSQHPALFDMTVSSNIVYGTPRDSIDQSKIEDAAKRAHIHDFILSQLPQGYQTLLGDNASLVSGGQAQRLQIARALVQPRELLILDECTSALDPHNQKLVMNTIMDVKKEKTTLIVTHKLAVMEMCDYLIVVDNGTIAEMYVLFQPNFFFPCSRIELTASLFVTADL